MRNKMRLIKQIGISCFYALTLTNLMGCAQTASTRPTPAASYQTHEQKDALVVDRAPTAKTLYAMGDLLATQGKDRECEFILRRCIQSYPDFIPAYCSLAEYHLRHGQVDSAMELLLEAQKRSPRDTVVLNDLGMIHVIRKDYEKALQYFTQCAGIAPGTDRYRANMAMALGLLGRCDESKALYEQILPDELAQHNVDILCEDTVPEKSEDINK